MSLPEPSFIDRDANAVTADLIAFYEAISGKTLQPAQPEMLLINLTAYRETLLRVAIQPPPNRTWSVSPCTRCWTIWENWWAVPALLPLRPGARSVSL